MKTRVLGEETTVKKGRLSLATLPTQVLKAVLELQLWQMLSLYSLFLIFVTVGNFSSHFEMLLV